MKKLFILLIILTPLLSKSQDCYSKKDPFTGVINTSGTIFLFGKQAPGSGVLVFVKNNEAMKIIYSFESALAPTNFESMKMTLSIKFINGEVRVYNANKESVVTTFNQGALVGFASNATFEDFNYLHDHSISIIRLSYKGDQAVGYDTEISESLGKKIKKAVECVL